MFCKHELSYVLVGTLCKQARYKETRPENTQKNAIARTYNMLKSKIAVLSFWNNITLSMRKLLLLLLSHVSRV